MNFRAAARILGSLMLLLGAVLLVPFGLSLSSDGPLHSYPFLLSSCISAAAGAALQLLSRGEQEIGRKECFFCVTCAWIATAAIGAIPLRLSGSCGSFCDAFFEAMSGLTTTGATVLTTLEGQPMGILFWRSLLQWLGGMGIILLFIAVFPSLSMGGAHLFKAEVPGHTPERLKPRIKQTAKALWMIYVGLTLLETLILWAEGMTLFDAVTHSFATMSTGGFSTRTHSIAAWKNPWIHVTVTVFMFLGGVNFTLYYRALCGNWRAFALDAEFKCYLGLLAGAAALLAAYLVVNAGLSPDVAVKDSAFQVVSVMTTTGYSTADFDTWGPFAKALLLSLMLVGGCAGSTGGAIKVGRILIAARHSVKEVYRFVFPRAVTLTKVNGSVITDEVLSGLLGFILIYIGLFVASTLAMTTMGLDVVSSAGAVAATLGNVGPGLGSVGPSLSYAGVPVAGKWLLSFLMMAGRLELYTVLVMFLPSFWRAS